MTIRTTFPFSVRLLPHVWIPLPDGSRLAARIWMPERATDEPVPAVLEYVPYRKNDELALRDAPIHAYFAGHGYAAVRVDIRGSGDSDGILEDEYLPLEQSDGVEVVRWLASQPWCSGRVGIIGKSWGGFNALQIAALAPGELGAIISVASTDDRYSDDVHYMGGCVLAWTALNWASTMLAYNARPPDPAVVGDEWRKTWFERMGRTPPFIESWMSHQRRDEFWKQGSVCEDYSAISCPVYMIGGWSDAYRNSILRFLEHYGGPCKGLIGPWAHVYPHDGAPGPAIGFLQECVQWWDHWLKDRDTGIMSEPKLRIWMGDARRPAPGCDVWPGRWLACDGWPAREVSVLALPLEEAARGEAEGSLRGRAHQLGPSDPVEGAPSDGTVRTDEAELRIRGAEAVALDPGGWGGHGGPIDCPSDQRADDGLSLSFDSDPLPEPAQILGFPIARLEVASDRPLALVVARLCDVWPDGASTLITRGLMNLTHHASDEEPQALVPGRRFTADVKLNAIAYSVPAGHRLRLAISPSYWPWAWPSPEPVTLSVFVGGSSSLQLPLADGVADYQPPEHFYSPEQAAPPAHVPAGSVGRHSRRLLRDVASGTVEFVSETGSSEPLRLLESGLEYSEDERDLYRIVDGEPLSAFTSSEREIEIARGDWRIVVRTFSTMSATDGEFQLTNRLDGYEGSRRVFTKTWHLSVPRDHV